MVTRTFANSNDKTTLMASVKLNMNQNYNTVITEKYIMPIGNISVRWHCKQISVKFSRDERLARRDETLVSRDETLVSRDETLVSREGGNLLLSGTV